VSLFTKLGATINGSSESEAAEEAEDTGAETADQTGPNFMPEKQEDLYRTAYANVEDLHDTGVCGVCGTTLSPFRTERLFASCKNEECENHLNAKEQAAVERFEERQGHPEDLASHDDLDASGGDTGSDGSALDGLSETIETDGD